MSVVFFQPEVNLFSFLKLAKFNNNFLYEHKNFTKNSDHKCYAYSKMKEAFEGMRWGEKREESLLNREKQLSSFLYVFGLVCLCGFFLIERL